MTYMPVPFPENKLSTFFYCTSIINNEEIFFLFKFGISSTVVVIFCLCIGLYDTTTDFASNKS